MFGNFVFDMDGAMVKAITYENEKVEAGVREKMGEKYLQKHCLSAADYPHYVFPGYYALFRWLYNQGGKIFFFSSGIERRNVELAEKMMKKAFGENVPEYKVYSRKHCIDTSRPFRQEEMREKYQSFFFGNYKKKMGGIVVPEEEVPNSLLIEDDSSYMVKGEEYNLVKVIYSIDYLHDRDYRRNEAYRTFHKGYYLTGLLAKMFEYRDENNSTLIEASKHVQMELEGQELSRDFYYPSTKRTDYIERGFKILKEIDPDLEIYYEKTEADI